MKSTNNVVEIVGFKNLSVTKKAHYIVKKAGYKAKMKEIGSSDLPYIGSVYGVRKLPFARVSNHTFQGMNEIRNHFKINEKS